MVKAGQYRERAEFQRLLDKYLPEDWILHDFAWSDAGLWYDSSAWKDGQTDAYGNVYTEWSSLATRWADMRETTGKEAIEGGAMFNTGMATMRVRSDSTTQGVTTADRVVIRGVTWAIKGLVQIDRKNTILEFKLERGVAA